MKKQPWLLVLSLTVLATIACKNPTDPAAALRGTWVLDHAKCSAGVPLTYNKFTVNTIDSYQITGYDEAKIEEGPIRNVTTDSFEYTITLQTEFPSYVGKDRYAKWQVVSGELTTAFYSDATMSTYYVTFVAVK